MKTDKITEQQRRALFLFHKWVADSMNEQNITLDKLVVEIKPKPTKDSLHIIFKAILESMYHKDTTKNLSREEMNACLEVYMDALSLIGVHLDLPDQSKRALLEFFN